MDANMLRQIAHRQAEELPGSSLEYPFGFEWEVFKVRGKVFMLVSDVTGTQMVIVKAEPEEGIALREAYAEITPGYHMNKRHWIALTPGESLDADLVREIITDSYRLVVAKLPRSQRPVGTPGRAGGVRQEKANG